MTDAKEFTHVAYGRKRLRRGYGPWKSIGDARLEASGDIYVLLDRLSIGFDGHVYLVRIGVEPNQPGPGRPAHVSADDEI
jgi:hypothetical protein